MPVLKNKQYEIFAQAIAAGQTADAAYVEAGFKKNRSNAARLNARDPIQKRIAELLEAAAERSEITGADVNNELARIGLSDIRQAFDENGNLLPIHELPDNFAKAVSSIKIVTRNKPGSDGAEVEYATEIKLWDKNSALEKLAKRFRIYEDDAQADPAAVLLAAIMGGAKPLPVVTADQEDGDDE